MAAVVGDGAVGLCGVIAASASALSRSSSSGVIPTGSRSGEHSARPTSSAERGEEAVERVRELTGGFGAHAVLECVGHGESTRHGARIARPGGAVGRVGVPQEDSIPEAVSTLFRNITISGGVAPARAYIEELLPDVLDGTIEPGRVFDRVIRLDETPDGYRAMNDRAGDQGADRILKGKDVFNG